MRIINWQFQKQPNRPAYCLTRKIFKVNTMGFEAPALNELYSLIWEYMNHSFLIVNDDPSAFWNAPPNVVPILHSDSPRYPEVEFREVTEGSQYRGISLYIKYAPIFTANKYDIALISGMNYDAMKSTLNNLKIKGTPCYVESYRFNPPTGDLNTRDTVVELLDDASVEGNLFLYEFRKEYYQLSGHLYPTVQN